MKQKEPIFNYSEPSLLIFIGVLALIHALRLFPATESMLQTEYWGYLIPLEIPNVPIATRVSSLLGHGFLHADWMHLFMNASIFLIFGLVTLRAVRVRYTSRAGVLIRFWLIVAAGIIGGGLAQWADWSILGANGYALGASGGASALFATAGWAMGGRSRLIGFAMAYALINVAMVLFKDIFGNVAWAAHVGGFIAGALLAPYWVQPFSAKLSVLR